MATDSARPFHTSAIVLSITAALLLGACAQSTGGDGTTSLLGSPSASSSSDVAAASDPNDTRSELEKATDYWGKKYRKNPRDKEAAVAYAKNLRAAGEKRQALAVLQQAAMFHATDREVASEYGRLALEFDQVGIAKQMLASADDPGNPDWRVISARGTVMAKEGKFADATPLFERALSLAPTEPSVLNNLAMSYAMGGDAAKAEIMLRRIEASGATANPKIRQNLALVLGLQGRFDESKAIASQEIGQDGALANANLLRQFVKAQATPTTSGPAVAGWSATAAEGKKAKSGKKASSAKASSAPKNEANEAAQDAFVAPVTPSLAADAPELAATPVSASDGPGKPGLRGMSR